nr:hypothetical protein [Brevundimonas naejangsanensis]
MRTHSQIISDAGGPSQLKRLLNLLATIHTVRSWAARDSIPAAHWNAVVAAGLATLQELADAAELRRASAEKPPEPANDDAPASEAA